LAFHKGVAVFKDIPKFEDSLDKIITEEKRVKVLKKQKEQTLNSLIDISRK